MSYDWSFYYKTAYEREKRKNTMLAGKVADSEAKRDFLQEKLQNIEGNICFKMLKPFKLVKKVAQKLSSPGNGMSLEVSGHEAEKQRYKAEYAERLAKQADSYAQWIEENEQEAFESVYRAYPDKTASVVVIPYCKAAGIRKITELEMISPETEEVDEAGRVLLFTENPECLDKCALEVVERYFSSEQPPVLLYGNEDQCIKDADHEKRVNPWLKPVWSENTLFGHFYFGSYFAVRADVAKNIAWLGDEDFRKNIYDFCLKVCQVYHDKQRPFSNALDMREIKILNCDLILYHSPAYDLERAQRSNEGDREYFLHSGETIEEFHSEYWGYEKDYTDLKQNYLKSLGIESKVYQTAHPQVYTVVPTDENPKTVSVIIPSKDHPDVLGTCLKSFMERTNYKQVEFIIVDNGSNEENKACIEEMLSGLEAEAVTKNTDWKYRYLYVPMEFNFSAMCNLGAKEAKGEYLLLLNDDIEIIEENWLDIMVGQAMLPHTGAVGAKLWYPQEERIQHTGITNMEIGPSHKLVTFPDDRTYYFGHNTLPKDMLAVTAAALLVKTEIYHQVGGLDEAMKVAYNDVDFCFKVYEHGYYNVIRNDAVLIHHESLSRGLDEDTPEKWQRLLQEKTNLYSKHPMFKGYDPFYSKFLVGNAPDYRISYLYPFERPLDCVKPERKDKKDILNKCLEKRIMLTVERAVPRNKIHLEEPDIYYIEGWCYMLNAENSQFTRQLVLESIGEDWYLLPCKERNRPDVKAILPLQKDIELSGFTCRILKEDLTSGEYAVGILYHNEISGKRYYQRSSAVLHVN